MIALKWNSDLLSRFTNCEIKIETFPNNFVQCLISYCCGSDSCNAHTRSIYWCDNLHAGCISSRNRKDPQCQHIIIFTFDGVYWTNSTRIMCHWQSSPANLSNSSSPFTFAWWPLTQQHTNGLSNKDYQLLQVETAAIFRFWKQHRHALPHHHDKGMQSTLQLLWRRKWHSSKRNPVFNLRPEVVHIQGWWSSDFVLRRRAALAYQENRKNHWRAASEICPPDQWSISGCGRIVIS